MKKTNKKGFTIVELVIVIAVIAILAAVLIPNISRLVKKANESSDIQAVRNMNTFLAAEKVTDGVDSILDVYDLFKESGYNVNSYSPLYSGRHFYYDKQYNQIVYVDTKTGKVIYPEEHKDELQGDHDWFTLSMEAPEAKKPSDNNYTANSDTITATVSNVAEYAYVIEEYNKGKVKNLTLTLEKDLDLMGARCVIKEAKGEITIQAKENQQVVIKNITNNQEIEQENVRNEAGIQADYYGAGIIATCAAGSKITFQNVTFENINVKVPTAGQIGVLIGFVGGSAPVDSTVVTFDNVTVKNCSVIGHRDVGALVGGVQAGTVVLKNNITIENTRVKTTGGRSALVVGKLNGKADIKTESVSLKLTGSSLSVYEDSSLEQKFATSKDGWEVDESYDIVGQTQYVYSYKGLKDGKKAYSAYGYRADALVLIDKPANAWYAVTSLTELEKGVSAK